MKRFVVAFVAGLPVLCATPALAQGTDPSPRHNLREDRRDLREDRHDLREDRRDLREDRHDRRHDRREERRHDRREDPPAASGVDRPADRR